MNVTSRGHSLFECNSFNNKIYREKKNVSLWLKCNIKFYFTLLVHIQLPITKRLKVILLIQNSIINYSYSEFNFMQIPRNFIGI